jgi:flagellar biosynthesis protein FlhF
MIAKTYKGKSIQQALDQIKSELGADAMILSTQQVASRRMFGLLKRQGWEVTAGIKEPAPEQKAAAPANAGSRKKRGDVLGLGSLPASSPARISAAPERAGSGDPRVDELLQEVQGLKRSLEVITRTSAPKSEGVRSQLLSKGLSADAAERLMFALRGTASGSINDRLRDALAEAFRLDQPVELTGKGRVVSLFAGPAGMGKTTTIGKIAGHAKARYNKRVALISTDTQRVGKHEQLSAYGHLLNIPVYACADFAEVHRLLSTLDDDLILIDTPGINPQDAVKAKATRTAAAVANARLHIVISAATRSEEFLRIVKTLGSDDCRRVLLSKLDEVESIAHFVSGTLSDECVISYLTNGESVPGDLVVPTAEELAHFFLPKQATEAAALAL